jgi:hypothetical protein
VVGLSICRKDAVEWLTDEHWIVFCFYSGFTGHLEQCYFTPGTLKSAEFEIMVAPVALIPKGMYGVAPFCRVKDTPENRELLRTAIAEFHANDFCPHNNLAQTSKNYDRKYGKTSSRGSGNFFITSDNDRSQNISLSKSKVKFDFCTVRTVERRGWSWAMTTFGVDAYNS